MKVKQKDYIQQEKENLAVEGESLHEIHSMKVILQQIIVNKSNITFNENLLCFLMWSLMILSDPNFRWQWLHS